MGTYFLNCLADLRDEFEIVGDVRGKGLMIGVEMVQDKVSDMLGFLKISYPNCSMQIEEKPFNISLI